jgi:hypothetical protein
MLSKKYDLGLVRKVKLSTKMLVYCERCRTGLNRSRAVFCGLSIFLNDHGPQTGPQSRSFVVFQFSGLLQSWSGPVSVFGQSQDWTSKHYPF